MLVLSRRENQKILFPNLGITVEIVGLKGKTVKLGVDAPSDIRIQRAELVDQAQDEPSGSQHPAESPKSVEKLHRLNNQLNSVALQMQIARKLFESGNQERAMNALECSIARLQQFELEAGMDTPSKEAVVGKTNSSRKALLVEDDPNERQLMATVLQLCGFEVDAVEDGAAAIEYLNTHRRPDCVLMDMQMPKMSGPEAIAQIRNDLAFADVLIYGVSGLPRHQANIPDGDRGVTGWFAKPVDARKLVCQIENDFQGLETTSEPSLN